MRVAAVLCIIFFSELAALGFLFMPFSFNTKKSIILKLRPLFVKLQFVTWTIAVFVGFVFTSTFYDSIQNPAKVSNEVIEIMPNKLLKAEAQRDAMLSFASLLLFPIIQAHGKLMFQCFSLQQSNEAMTKQAKSASDYARSLLSEKEKSQTDKKKLR